MAIEFKKESFDYRELTLLQFTKENIPKGWEDFFTASLPYIEDISENLTKLVKEGQIILPTMVNIYRAFYLCPFSKIRVVILGMDPYPNPGDSIGLCFSTFRKRKIPASLRNIYKELELEGFTSSTSPDISKWIKQGVLLINAALTVQAHNSGSHLHIWKEFTQYLISYISNKSSNIVWILWGKDAKNVCQKLIDEEKHCIITGYHPSPYNTELFLGGNYFRKCNDYLFKSGLEEVDWNL